jgi:hypothetical protein
VENPENRTQIFLEQSQTIEPFRVFLEIINNNSGQAKTINQICEEFEKRLGINLSKATIKWHIKIFFNWARFSKIITMSYTSRKNQKPKIINQQKLI